MKILFSIFVLVPLLNSSEINIIEEAVEDITKLKNDYKMCQEDLKSRFVKTNYKELENYKILLKKEKEKNTKMLEDMKWFTQTIESLENNLNANKQELLKIKQNQKRELVVVKQKVIKQEIVKKKEVKLEKIEFFKATTFRLKEDSSIYDKINGTKINDWVKNRTFTSNIKSDNWIKITGYFVKKAWKKAQIEMWIESDKVLRRK